jgi:hypothetical protein
MITPPDDKKLVLQTVYTRKNTRGQRKNRFLCARQKEKTALSCMTIRALPPYIPLHEPDGQSRRAPIKNVNEVSE